MKTEMEIKTEIPNYKKSIVVILAIFLIIFPYITYLKIVEYSDAEASVFYSYDGIAIDLFLYYKELTLIIAAVLLILWFAGERIFPDRVYNNIPLIRADNKFLFTMSGIFALSVLISTVFSENKKTAVWGSPTEGEGMFTLIGCIILIFAFYNYFGNTYGIKIIKRAIVCESVITIFLSLIEYFYKAIIEIEFVQKLIAPKEYVELIASVKTDTFSKAVSLSFYNPSYYGGFVCILVPFMLMFCIYSVKAAKKIMYGLICAGLFFCVIASNSTTALYITISECAFAFLWMLVKNRHKKYSLIKCGIAAIGFFAVIIVSSLISENGLMSILKNNNSNAGKTVSDRFEVENLILESNSVFVEGKDRGLRITYEDGQVELTDEKNKKLSAVYEDGTFIFDDADYENIKVEMLINNTYSGNNADKSDISKVLAKIRVDAGYDDTIDFYILNDGTISGVGQNNSIVRDIGSAGVPDNMEKYYGVFTGRGYAWINSAHILGKTVVKGVGPGNFAYYFKQNDYMGMLKTHGSTKYIIDKPHNTYIQYGINIGIIGMLSFFSIIIYSVKRAIKAYAGSKKEEAENADILMGGCGALAGFLIYSFINDSIVTVTPVVCMIVGLVLAACYLTEKGENNGKA